MIYIKRSPETPVNNLNDPILLFRRHLVIGRQAQPSAEDIGSDIDPAPGYVRVRPASAVPLDCSKGVGAVYRLHMHGL